MSKKATNVHLMQADVMRLFDRLSGSALEKFNRSAAQLAAKELKSDVRDKFLEKLPNAAKTNPDYSDTLLDAVRQGSNATNRSDEIFGRSIVHVLGSRDSDSGTYRARFFELGTIERHQKKVRYTDDNGKLKTKKFKNPKSLGKITALKYLAEASKSFQMKLSVEEVLESYIKKIQNQQ